MRSNGLTASSYLPVADLNPSVAEQLLVDLKEKRIAAYSQPVESSPVLGLSGPEFHGEILVRLYVDAAATEQARETLSAMDPYLVRGNDDLTWAQIVASYDTPASSDVAPWPVYEDIDLDVDPEPDTDAMPSEPPQGEDDPRARRRSAPPETPDEERFVPPPPPPLPRLSGADQLGWVGVVGGPAVLLVAAMFSLTLPTWLILIAALGFIAGFVSLVVRMDDGQSRLDDPDDGAQI